VDGLGHVDDRSPVIIPRDRFAEWLDPDLTDKDGIQHLLDSLPEPTLTPRIVSPRVDSVRNNSPELIEPAKPPAKIDSCGDTHRHHYQPGPQEDELRTTSPEARATGPTPPHASTSTPASNAASCRLTPHRLAASTI
jgi:hypothetical protein